jgi:hypothetical protein
MAISSRLALLACLVSLPAYAGKPQIQWDEDYDFSTVQTYQWQAPPDGVSLERADPFLHDKIVTAIEMELAAAGLSRVESGADVFVTYYASKDTEVRLESDSYGYGFGGYGMGGWGYYGYGVGGPVSTTTRVVEYEEGTLVIDIWEPDDQQLVWRGSVSGILLSEKPEKTQKNVLKAIEAMAKQNAKLRERERSRDAG